MIKFIKKIFGIESPSAEWINDYYNNFIVLTKVTNYYGDVTEEKIFLNVKHISYIEEKDGMSYIHFNNTSKIYVKESISEISKLIDNSEKDEKCSDTKKDIKDISFSDPLYEYLQRKENRSDI